MVTVLVVVMAMFMVRNIMHLIIQHMNNRHEYLVMMMMRHHGMSQYQHIG